MSAEPAALRTGDLSFALDGADLIDLRWGGLDLASRIQVTVRDPGWGTVAPTLRSRSVDASPGRVRVTLIAAHEPVGFAWRATVDADEGGELAFAFEGQAERAFEYRRIGVCVLHPWRAYVGATYEATTPHGPRRGTFPMPIAPQPRVEGRYLPMIEAFSHLAVGFPAGEMLELDLDGELFELEDQRNWTDASFKTYPTPLARSEPRTIRAGERVRQRAVLRVRGTPPEIVDPGMSAVTIGAATGRAVPPIGMSLASDPIAGAAHTRVELLGTDPDPAALARAATAVELALYVEPGAPDASRVAPLLEATRLERVLVLRADEETSSSELVAEVRTQLGALARGVPFVGGTSTSFSELNRNPPSGRPLDGVVFAISPQVHAEDERSVRETIEIQAQVLRQAHELTGRRPVHVSPVSLTAHLGTPFAEAWTVGSLATLICADAASITIDAASRAAEILAALRGAQVLDVEVSDPRRVVAVGVLDGHRRRIIVVNLTGDPTPFLLDGTEREPLQPYEVWISDDEATASS